MAGSADETSMMMAEFPGNPTVGDHLLHVTFFQKQKQDEQKSAEQGRPIFKDVPYIRIIVPGDRDIRERPVETNAIGSTPPDPARWPKQWAQFKAGEKESTTGTPLSQWPRISRSEVEELAFFHVRTVEELAAVSDEKAQRFAGVNQLRIAAKDFLESAKDSGAVTKMRAELTDRDSKIAALQHQVEELAAEVKASRQDAEKPAEKHPAPKKG